MRRSPIKRARKKGPTAEEKRHMDRVAALGCLVCRMPAELHHVTSDGLKRITRSHRRVTPLCPRHHRIGVGGWHESVEGLSHDGFTATFGIDLLAVADKLWEESQRKEARDG